MSNTTLSVLGIVMGTWLIAYKIGYRAGSNAASEYEHGVCSQRVNIAQTEAYEAGRASDLPCVTMRHKAIEHKRQPYENKSTVVNLDVPKIVTSGASFVGTIRMRNTGTTTWARGGETPWRLGSQYPTDNTIWGVGRVELPMAEVKPGEEVALQLKLKAPVTPAEYQLAWAMLRENVEWFGEVATERIQVRAAKLESLKPPAKKPEAVKPEPSKPAPPKPEK